MFKGVVIQLILKIEVVCDSLVLVVLYDNILLLVLEDCGWFYDVCQLQVVDSVFFFQYENGEQVIVCDICLQMEQDENYWVIVDFFGWVNCDQCDLVLSFFVIVQGGDYLYFLKVDFIQFSWQLCGVEFLLDGINGQGSLQVSWQEDDKILCFDNLNLMVNCSIVIGSGSVVLGDCLDWLLDLYVIIFDFDSLLV